MTPVVVFDFDKTLSPVYMQHVIFEAYGVDENQFWKQCQKQARIDTQQWGSYNSELVYMHELIRLAQEHPDLSNQKLRVLGKHIPLFPGVASLLGRLHQMQVPTCILSSGLSELLYHFGRNHNLWHVWAGHFYEDQQGRIAQPAITIGAEDKPKYLKQAVESLRTDPHYMLYVGDGESDIPAFEWVRDHGGCTLGVETMHNDRLHQMYQEGLLSAVLPANYCPGAAAYNWIIETFLCLRNSQCAVIQ